MLKTADVGRNRRLIGAAALTILCTASGLGAWAAKPAEVTYAPAAAEPALVDAPISSAPASPGAFVADTVATDSTVETAPEIPEPAAQSATANGYAVQSQITDAEATGTPVSVEGSILRVMWVNPQARITIVDANGQEVTVYSQTPNTLLRQGINRDALAAGAPISISGYRDANGLIQARGRSFFRDGVPLAVNDEQGVPLGGASQSGPGAVIEQSPLTNSVIREGESR